MIITIAIVDGPVPASPLPTCDNAGARLCFEGIVRPSEAGQPIIGLDYETYDPMAHNQLEQLAGRVLQKFALIAIDVQHSRGFVAAGACSFRLVINSRHRGEGLAAAGEFIDQMKQDVPIWKRPVYNAR